MKKFLAFALAFAMVISMASVAFAAETAPKFGFVGETAFQYDEEKGFSEVTDVNFGDEVYYFIGYAEKSEEELKKTEALEELLLQDSEIAEKFKVKPIFTSGGEYVESVKLVKKNFTGAGAYYFLELSLKDAPLEVDSKDIIGEVTVSASKLKFALIDTVPEKATEEEAFADEDESEDGILYTKDVKLQIALTAKNPQAENLDETMNELYVFDFEGKEDEETEIYFYGDMGHYVVDTNGQGKLVIKTDVDYNRGLEGVSPDVNYVYFNGNNATFNKIGTLTLKANEGNHIYRRNTDNTLTKIAAEYNADEEGFVIRTRVIGSYVISEKELDVENINASAELLEEKEEVSEESSVPVNPSTGVEF